jgi:hypothetical protein
MRRRPSPAREGTSPLPYISAVGAKKKGGLTAALAISEEAEG